jgi:hypothetical protein
MTRPIRPQRPRTRKLIAFAVTSVLMAGAAALGVASAANASTGMTLACSSPAGGTITVESDFGPLAPGETAYRSVSISVNNGPAEQTATPGSDGIYTAYVPYSNVALQIAAFYTDQPSSYIAYDSFAADECVEPTPTPTPTPDPTPTPEPTPTADLAAILSSVSVTAGSSLTVTATGFTPNESVDIWLHSTPIKLGTYTVGSDGTLVQSVTIPDGAAIGAHQIEVRGAYGSAWASLTVTAGLAATGADLDAIPSLLGMAGLVMAGGLAALLIARRRVGIRQR